MNIRFVCGPPRSGTTLLASMLTGGEAYPMLSECSVITSAIRNRLSMRVADDPNRLRPYVRDDLLFDEIYEKLVSQILESLLSGFPEKRMFLVLKDPFIALILPSIHRFFSMPLRTICIVRDPRDVVASYMMVSRRLEGKWDINHATSTLLPFYQAIEQAQKSPSPLNPILTVRYEDLVSNVDRVYSELEQFCGYSVYPAGYREVSEWALEDDGVWHVGTYGRPTTSERIGEFKNVLTKYEINFVEKAFSKQINDYGYD